ncbi:inositol 1,4,5-triphosphate receptor associated 2 isoform X4 [Hirundo rustica]|uniref:inositol 1,4,5-triphosphate receptor associated 2 isoform X4 n=1 Tax=Hirundo rustica TaxID=43150 RepID=UPI001A943FEB|nr:inositol 1,4,5-triphosphate receptor associated 2 isoform X4 [Hirundo rustica]
MVKSLERGAKKRHHNPVDSICRKIKSIQMMDQVSNPALQIPKFQSRNFDSPQSNTKKNLEEILKGRTCRSWESTCSPLVSPDSDSVFAANSPGLGATSDSCSAQTTFSILKSSERPSSSWMPPCPMESSSPYCFGPREANAQKKSCALANAEPKDVRPKQKHLTSSPNVYFFTSEKKVESAVVQPPVPKTFPSSERGGRRQTLGYKADNTYNVSLICEEDLLTTIFCACDIHHTGKVAVSKIIDYLRHTTSRESEDSGLEELCNMLDPEHKDISMDLETYHAIMGEWIEDCKRKWEEGATEESSVSTEDLEFQVPKNISEAKKTHVWMNVTSGSLEAFGGDVSKGDMETSDLITCIADLQYNNQKLQEENSKLKLTLEAVDETNSKLLADNEHLHQQLKSIQHSVLKAKSLEEELEEARNNLNLSEEKREQILWQNKQLQKENQSLNIKVTSLQEEIIRNSMDTNGLQKKILELSKNAAQLQIQAHIYESTVVNKEASLIQKEQDIKELRLTIVECSSVIETLRAEKNKLLENIQHMQQELISNGLSFPLLYKFNSNIPEGMDSLHCELELAQSSEIIRTEWTSLDETLDREVLLLLQGPEYAGEKFKTIMQNLQEEVSEAEELVTASLERENDPNEGMPQAWERKLEALKQELGEKRHLWTQKLQLLEKCKESLDKDFIRVAGNLRRTKTEQLHLRKELSARQREMETARQLQEETAGQAEALRLELQKATKQLEDASKHAEDQVEAFHSACEEAASLKSKLEEAISEQQKLRDVNAALASTCQLLQEKVEDHKTTANALRWELLQRRLCELLCQCCAELESDYALLPTLAEHVKGKQLHCSKRPWSEGPTSYSDFPWVLPLGVSHWHSSPLLDALTLETSCPNNPPGHSWNQPCRQSSGRCTLEKCDVGHVSSSDVTSGECRWKICSADDYTDADLPVSIAMMDSSLAEIDRGESRPPASPIPSSDHLTSAREALAPSVESTAPVPGCLVMEQRTSKGLHERGEDVSTSAATETNSDKDPAAPVSGPGQIKKESCLVMEEHEPVFQSVLKQDQELGQEKKSNKEQSEEAPAVVPSRKGSSPTAGGIKGDKTKQNEPDSPNEKEVEAEFLRLSLGFKCDLFTLDKRVKLEERSRDLAEENLKKEITNAVNMLEALVPLCEEDNQAQEIIKKLQKSLQFLSQYAARVASRAEMLGAINQESRVSKAVEVMIQHVENLKRMYAKEHAELEELKQVLLQNERSFSCLGDRDESMNKKLPSPFNFKPSSALRRVSIATVPRSAGNAGTGVPLAQLHEPDGDERSDRFSRRSSSWGRLGVKQNEKRPSLQRFLSTYSWAEYEEEHFETKNEQLESPAEVQEQPTRKESVSEKGKYSSKWTLESMYSLMSVWTSHFKASFCNANKTLWVSVSILVLLAALTSFLTGLSLQRPADAAPVGTGDSWTSVQQLLWPYTGLQHNGPPPV